MYSPEVGLGTPLRGPCPRRPARRDGSVTAKQAMRKERERYRWGQRGASSGAQTAAPSPSPPVRQRQKDCGVHVRGLTHLALLKAGCGRVPPDASA